LLVDLHDAERDQLVWHGWTSTEWPQQGAQAANTPQLVERAQIDRFRPEGSATGARPPRTES
jgi:hypothetical protein